MRKDRKTAFILRGQGKTYNEITQELGVSKGTLSFWFKNVPSSVALADERMRITRSPEHLSKMRAGRVRSLAAHYLKAKQEAEEIYKQNKDEPLFVAGLGIYWGEGDKSLANNMARVANADPKLLRVSKLFFDKYFPTTKGRIKIWLLLYPNNNPEESLKYWSKEVGLPRENFYKPQVIKGKSTKRTLPYGVGNVIFSGKYTKVQVIHLIELMGIDLIKRA